MTVALFRCERVIKTRSATVIDRRYRKRRKKDGADDLLARDAGGAQFSLRDQQTA